jgi:hypothetical protein
VSPAAILTLGLGIVLGLPLIYRIANRRLDPFEPIVLFVLAYGAMFVARPASMLARGDFTYFGVDMKATFPRALLLAFSGGVAFVTAYELGAGRRFTALLPAPRPITTRVGVAGAVSLLCAAVIAVAVVVWPVGLIEGAHILVSGRSDAYGRLNGEVSDYVRDTTMFVVPASLVLFALALRERSALIALSAAGSLVLALLLIVPAGSRIFLLPLLGGGLTFMYVRRGRVPSAPTVAIWGLLAIFGSYVLLTVRDPGTRAHLGSHLTELPSHPGWLLDPILRGPDAEMAPALAGALQAVPSRLHYRYGGAVLGDLLVRPIPRQLWHGKPKPEESQVVGAVWPSFEPYLRPAFSPILWFFWDFGIYGVLGGMAVFGLLARSMYEWLLRYRSSSSAQLIYSVALWTVVIGCRDAPTDTVVLAAFVVGPLILIERMSARLNRPQRIPS